MNDSCKTKYPIVMVHGTGFRHRKIFNYWGRIPKALEAHGATVYYAESDAFGSIENNAELIRASIFKMCGDFEKVNLIAHSKGGLDCRYMISKLGMADRVASLTTIATPHLGSKTLAFFWRFPKFLLRFVGFFINAYFHMLGDKKADFYTFVKEISSDGCAAFNKEVLDQPDIYYQSYATKMKNSSSDMILFIPYLVLKKFEGDNDGIVGVESAAWGEFQGIVTGKKNRGVSHADSVDLRRMDTPGFDIRQIYIEMVERLVLKGF
ncbi:MAG: alpha/beta fold hydrolase [Clostridia bacterium]